MDVQIWTLLFRCQRDFSHNKLRDQNISDTECLLCTYVSSHEGCSQDDAAAALKMDKTTVAKALLALENRGIIERTQDTADKRIKRLRLTADGREKVSGLLELHNAWLTEVMSCLTPEEQAQFESCCERLLTAAEALSAKQKTEETENARK